MNEKVTSPTIDTMPEPVRLTPEAFDRLANEQNPHSKEALEYMGSLGLKGGGIEPIIIVGEESERVGFINTHADDFGTFVRPENVAKTAEEELLVGQEESVENEPEVVDEQERIALDTARDVETQIKIAMYNGSTEQIAQLLPRLENAIVEMRRIDPHSLKAAMLDAHLENLRMGVQTGNIASLEPSVLEVENNLK